MVGKHSIHGGDPMETNDVSLTNVTQNSSLVSRIMGNARIKLARLLAGELSYGSYCFF